MARSYYHTPITSVTGCRSSKAWRRQENRRYRAYAKNHMRHGRYDDIQGYCGTFANEWHSLRDGKYWFGEVKYIECSSRQYYKWGMVITTCRPGHYHSCVLEYKKQMRK